MFELDDEYTESDIPTTLIRSKADCPTVEVLYMALSQLCFQYMCVLMFNLCVCVCVCVCVRVCVCACVRVQVATLTTNDIVINKLTQILSYLRQGARSGKKGRKRESRWAARGMAKEELHPEPQKDRYACTYCTMFVKLKHTHTHTHTHQHLSECGGVHV